MLIFLRRLKYRFKSKHKQHSYYKYRKNRQRLFTVIYIFGVIALCIIGFVKIEKRIGPIAQQSALSTLEKELISDANQAVVDALIDENIDSKSLLIAEKNIDGIIQSMSTDYNAINRLKSELAVKIPEILSNKKSIIAEIPIGLLFSDTLFTGVGFRIPFKIFASTTIDIRFYDDFTSAGINQTRYKLMAEIKIPAKVIGMLSQYNTEVVTQVPITETIIIGTVPQTYLTTGK